VTTRGELKEIEVVDARKLNAGKIAKGFDDAVILVVDDQRSTTLAMAAVTNLADACADLARIGHFDDVCVGVETLKKGDGFLGFEKILGRIRDNER
jgi:hypothetical protein